MAGRYPIETLERIRKNTRAQDWSALYLQNPVPDEGTYFLAEWLKPYSSLPPRDKMRTYIASDLALTIYSVHLVAALDPESRLYIIDL